MEKNRSMQKGKDRKPSPGASPAIPAESSKSDDVERVLEHVSSPYRWELLETQQAQPKTSVPKNTSQQK